jgi:hypothetical protein
MHDRAWQVPEWMLGTAWNRPGSLDVAAQRGEEVVGGKDAPRWAVLA